MSGALGSDNREACRLLREVRGERRVTPVDRTTVSKAAQTCLDAYVKAKRNPKGLPLATYRVHAYLEAFIGPKLVASVTANDLLACRDCRRGPGPLTRADPARPPCPVCGHFVSTTPTVCRTVPARSTAR
jgi:hypothetical protein